MPYRGDPNQKWDGRPRRKCDFDKEGVANDAVILARIDLRTENLECNHVDFKRQFSDHIKDDKTCFNSLRQDIVGVEKIIWRAGGIATGSLAVIMFILDVIFKH